MVWHWTPPTAHRTSTAPSNTRSARSTSMVKSTWPGRPPATFRGKCTFLLPFKNQWLHLCEYILKLSITNTHLFIRWQHFDSSQEQSLIPGVSIMLMLWFFHIVYVAADWMVMPLCLSSSIESMVAPTPSFPFTYTPHVRKKQQQLLVNAGQHTPLKLHLTETSRFIHKHDPSGHLVNLCYSARVVEDSLGQGGLPWVDVGWDPDVADPLVGEDTGWT